MVTKEQVETELYKRITNETWPICVGVLISELADLKLRVAKLETSADKGQPRG